MVDLHVFRVAEIFNTKEFFRKLFYLLLENSTDKLVVILEQDLCSPLHSMEKWFLRLPVSLLCHTEKTTAFQSEQQLDFL